MKRIGVISDVHGNLEALKAVLAMLDEMHCDEIIHTGDAVSIGPNSRECLDLLLSRRDITCLLGNHDRDFVLRHADVRMLSHVPAEHKAQVFATLTEEQRKAVMEFPLFVTRQCAGDTLLFCHYALAPRPFDWQVFPFMPLQNEPSVQAFDEIFASAEADAVFFGHKHEPCDFDGRMLYVDVGSVGCHPAPFARAVVIDYDAEKWTYKRVQTPYDMDAVKKKMYGTVACGKQLYDFYFLRKNVQ